MQAVGPKWRGGGGWESGRERAAAALTLLAMAAAAQAQRAPVLRQIDLPHSYYYREMYLPQLTSGPSSAAWAPNSQELVYSMQGSLWRQRLDSTMAEQLTAGPGYDYQPDWSRDGRWILFTRYDNDAMELFLLEPATGAVRQITSGGAVNLEPRWSPDGRRFAFVSTMGSGHFHIFIATLREGVVERIDQLTQERRSSVSRYYYSAIDHEISPTWSADGSEVVFVSNRERIYGSGGLWRMKVEPGAAPRLIQDEETTWKARPDWAPDGSGRLIYSSYLGREWHQLWALPASGGYPVPLSYGEFDRTAPRWSPDASRIAFISNQNGNPSLWIQEVSGGRQWPLVTEQRRFRTARSRLRITVLDPRGRPTAARVSVTDSSGRFYAPDSVWIHADDAFVRSERAAEAHYFHCLGQAELSVPAGAVTVEVLKGFEHKFVRRQLHFAGGEQQALNVQLERLSLPPDWESWVSGDLHVHMNYGGAYRNVPANLVAQADAENLQVIHNLIVNKEQRIPDFDYFSTRADPASTATALLLHGQEFHTSYWGHLGLLGLQQHFLLPDYAAYDGTIAASLFPTNAAIADLAHAQGALVGYVHPFDAEPDPSAAAQPLTSELPADVALGKVDYYEVVGFSDHHASAAVWYRLLNCGFRLAAGAGTDAMANFASLRGPVGMNRVYVLLSGPLQAVDWLDSLRRGRSFATNGPLLRLRVGGLPVGSELELPAGAAPVPFDVSLRSIVGLDHLQLVFNGKVVRELELQGDRTAADVSGTLPVPHSGWVVLRGWSELPVYPILDRYAYATTSPIYLTVAGRPVRSAPDATYFVAWLDRALQAAASHPGYHTQREKAEAVGTLQRARAIFAELH